MKTTMFNNAGPLIFERAKELRNNTTHAENILWQHLKMKPGGYKFRRQHPTGNYVLDFYCHAFKTCYRGRRFIHNQPEVIEFDVKDRET